MPHRRLALIAAALALVIPVGAVAWDLVIGESSARATETASATASATPSATPTPTASATPDTTTASTGVSSIVTIGDSIMAGYGLDDASAAWPALLGASTGVQVTNLGCSGAGFIAVGGCGTDFEGLIAQAVAADPDVVIIQSSDNDLGESADDIAAATTQTIAELHAALPDAEIVAFGTLWDQPGDVPDEVADSSSAIQAAAAAVGGTFIDLGQPLRGVDGLLQDDSEHPTVAGQQVLATAIQQALTANGVAL
jgi:acyl-CoA thioesterase I